jgi:hypothetical protein
MNQDTPKEDELKQIFADAWNCGEDNANNSHGSFYNWYEKNNIKKYSKELQSLREQLKAKEEQWSGMKELCRDFLTKLVNKEKECECKDEIIRKLGHETSEAEEFLRERNNELETAICRAIDYLNGSSKLTTEEIYKLLIDTRDKND